MTETVVMTLVCVCMRLLEKRSQLQIGVDGKKPVIVRRKHISET